MASRPLTRALVAVAFAAFAAISMAQPQPSGLQRLHDALHLTANQQGAWTAFAATAALDPEAAAQARSAQSMMPTLRSPQRVDLSVAAMRAQLEALERRGRALKTFYATLSPAQQATFDRETLPSREDERR